MKHLILIISIIIQLRAEAQMLSSNRLGNWQGEAKIYSPDMEDVNFASMQKSID